MWEEILKKIYELGYKYENENWNCAQCTLAAIQDIFDVGNDDIFKSASGLAGGSARMGDGNCGAYSGGIMALSHKFGRARENMSDNWGYEEAMELSEKLYNKFIEEYGSHICHDIQKKVLGRAFNVRDPKDREEFEKAGGHRDKCPKVVGKAAQWVAELLLEKGVPAKSI